MWWRSLLVFIVATAVVVGIELNLGCKAPQVQIGTVSPSPDKPKDSKVVVVVDKEGKQVPIPPNSKVYENPKTKQIIVVSPEGKNVPIPEGSTVISEPVGTTQPPPDSSPPPKPKVPEFPLWPVVGIVALGVGLGVLCKFVSWIPTAIAPWPPILSVAAASMVVMRVYWTTIVLGTLGTAAFIGALAVLVALVATLIYLALLWRKRFVQVVQGDQKFRETVPKEVKDVHSNAQDSTQDADTQLAVAKTLLTTPPQS